MNQTIIFNIKPLDQCNSDSDFPSEIFDEFIPEKFESLNYFKILNKFTIFYKVNSFF